MLGLLLDAGIRSQTGNRKSLDDAMRFFNKHVWQDRGEPSPTSEIIPIIER